MKQRLITKEEQNQDAKWLIAYLMLPTCITLLAILFAVGAKVFGL